MPGVLPLKQKVAPPKWGHVLLFAADVSNDERSDEGDAQAEQEEDLRMVPEEILDHRLTPTMMARRMPPTKKILSRLRDPSEL